MKLKTYPRSGRRFMADNLDADTILAPSKYFISLRPRFLFTILQGGWQSDVFSLDAILSALDLEP